ncbi:hypothetical protein ACFE04_012617 [Oxalis oulophora]
MKSAMRWNDDETSSCSSSDSDVDVADNDKTNKKAKHDSKPLKPSKVETGKQKAFDALKRYGYKGGLSILNVPAPKEEDKSDWSWSTGRDKTDGGTGKVDKESYQERQKTRYAVKDGELLENALTQKDRENKGISFSQKEKRKRELGQASRGKNYVEEEKRTLRDSGVYSGFDT